MATRKASPPADPTAELSAKIREAAYYHWERRGRPHGTALDDWLCAESLVLGIGAEHGHSHEHEHGMDGAHEAVAAKPMKKAIPKVKTKKAAAT